MTSVKGATHLQRWTREYYTAGDAVRCYNGGCSLRQWLAWKIGECHTYYVPVKSKANDNDNNKSIAEQRALAIEYGLRLKRQEKNNLISLISTLIPPETLMECGNNKWYVGREDQPSASLFSLFFLSFLSIVLVSLMGRATCKEMFSQKYTPHADQSFLRPTSSRYRGHCARSHLNGSTHAHRVYRVI